LLHSRERERRIELPSILHHDGYAANDSVAIEADVEKPRGARRSVQDRQAADDAARLKVEQRVCE
jgi:hypothetical protein